jgi:pSer/pThr/pTyr-binding forkhead associated (FHA) protein
MPVTVVVRSSAADGTSAGAEPELTFDGSRVVIGRSPGCDVRLPEPTVSLRHASIRAQGADFAIVDEGSTNGTWVGEVRLVPHTPRLVRSGDLVRIGRVWLELRVGQRPPTPDLGLATRDLALALVRSAMEAAGDDTCARVRVTEGPDLGAALRLAEEGRPYVIGRAERCDLPLADEDASREHVAVIRRGARVFLRDLASRNGVWLGEARLSPDREAPWRPHTMARVGLSVLALDEPVSLALADLEAAADERLPEEAAPAPPPSSVALPAAEEAAPAPASRAPGAAAPIAKAPEGSRTATTFVKKKRRVWTAADFAVLGIIAVAIGAGVAGLVWVLRG